MRPGTSIAALLAWAALSGAHGPAAAEPVAVDPLALADDDFARHRSASEWQGLTVTRIELRDRRGPWRLWRIASRARPDGPLWFVPHDDENAAFDAALVGLRSYGGVAIVVDSAVGGQRDGQRTVGTDSGGRADPNRAFDGTAPLYAATVLADSPRAHPIVALHTNARGFDPRESDCNRSDPPGAGKTSIRYCDAVRRPSPSQRRTWPFDDADSLAFLAHRSDRTPDSAWCGTALRGADFNIVFERVAASDGSLSNHALLHALDYVNLETQERGAGGIGEARSRLVAMIDAVMTRCLAPAAPIHR